MAQPTTNLNNFLLDFKSFFPHPCVYWVLIAIKCSYTFWQLGFEFFLYFLLSSRVSSGEMADRVESMREKYLVINGMRLIRELFSAIHAFDRDLHAEKYMMML